MALRIIRVYTNTLDLPDPKRVVTTNHNRYRAGWYTLKVKAETSAEAWGHAKRMQWASDRAAPGVVEYWRITPKQELEKLRSTERAGAT